MENNNKKNSNVIAIIGFVLSFFIGIAGLVCSIIGLVKSKQLKDGKAFSIAGIIISSLRILFTIFVFILGILIVVEESKDVIDKPREKIIERIEKKDEESKAFYIMKTKWESAHNYENAKYSYDYVGKYNNRQNKEFYVYYIKELDEKNIPVGYYAVSLEDNDYFFIENSPEFFDTGIIYLEPKTYSTN